MQKQVFVGNRVGGLPADIYGRPENLINPLCPIHDAIKQAVIEGTFKSHLMKPIAELLLYSFHIKNAWKDQHFTFTSQTLKSSSILKKKFGVISYYHFKKKKKSYCRVSEQIK